MKGEGCYRLGCMIDVFFVGFVFDEFSFDICLQDDFYWYVNGVWFVCIEILGDKVCWGLFYLLVEQVEKDVCVIIEELQDVEEGMFVCKIGDLFVSFMDIECIDVVGVVLFVEMFVEIDVIDGIFVFLCIVGVYDCDGCVVVIGFYVDGDLGNFECYLLVFVQVGFFLLDESYF